MRIVTDKPTAAQDLILKMYRKCRASMMLATAKLKKEDILYVFERGLNSEWVIERLLIPHCTLEANKEFDFEMEALFFKYELQYHLAAQKKIAKTGGLE